MHDSADTDIGGRRASFPTTRGSRVAPARDAGPDARRRSFDAVTAAYWKPVYRHVRLRWRRGNDDAKDLTQGFFAVAYEKRWLDAFDPAKARFRTFLRTCVDRFVANQDKAASRLKRGGGARVLSLDFAGAEDEVRGLEPVAPEDADRAFEAEWTRSVLALAVDRLRRVCDERGAGVRYLVFERYDLHEGPGRRPTYATIAADLGVAVTDVTNHLSWARREFRRALLEEIRAVASSEEEFRDEARRLVGGDPG